MSDLKIISKKKDMKKGWVRRSFFKSGQFLLPEAQPVALWKFRGKEENIYLDSDTCFPKSQTAWNAEGMKIKKGELPCSQMTGMVGGAKKTTWDVYGPWQVEPKKKRKELPPAEIDILLAIFTVNRATKRLRDAGQSLYLNKMHGLACSCKNKKTTLYDLKDKGICFALSKDMLEYAGMHGRYSLFTGAGYSFHSTLKIEQGAATVETGGDPIHIPSKHKTRNEARLKDAVYTLENLPETKLPEYIVGRIDVARPLNSVQKQKDVQCEDEYDMDDYYEEDDVFYDDQDI